MKISIAMATYNGGKYIQEQLDSFSRQLRMPDELVVCDDGSTDDTLKIIECFSKTVSYPVRVYRNEVNLGYAGNFDRAVGLCSGDLIFLSDQDDVWMPEKTETIEQEFRKDPKIWLIMNDAEIMLADGERTGLTKLGQTRSLGLDSSVFVTGCCMAFHKKLVPFFSPVPDCFVHDTWLNQLSLKLGIKKTLPQVLQFYRRHGDNASDWLSSKTTKASKMGFVRNYIGKDSRVFCLARLNKLQVLEDRINSVADVGNEVKESPVRVANAMIRIGNEKTAVDARLGILERPRFKRVGVALRCWQKGWYGYFSGWKSFAKDVLFK
jgi:glycosyltransferase involved in cell wall biosynthesis